MHVSVRSSLAAGVAVAVTGAMPVAVPPAPAPMVADVRLAADPVPIGGLVTSFLGNQVIYCSIICPDVVKLVVTVPTGALAAPVAFVGMLPSGDVLKAVGAAAASVTNPLNAAVQPIITNDLNLVLPRAQNALEVAVVGLLNIASSTPEGFLGTVQAARQNTFDALNDTIPPTRTSPNPRGLVQVAAVEAIEVLSSVAFQAFEEGLLGVVQTIDSFATTLANTGDLAAATRAGAQAAQVSATKSLNYVVTAVVDAVTNISAALHDPKSPSMTEGRPAVRSDAKDAKTHAISQILRKTDAPQNLTKQEGKPTKRSQDLTTRPSQLHLTNQEDNKPAKHPIAALSQAVRNTIKADEQDTPKAFKAAGEFKAPKLAKPPREFTAPKLAKPPKESKAPEVSRGHKADGRAPHGSGMGR
jgi:hypothetical protein